MRGARKRQRVSEARKQQRVSGAKKRQRVSVAIVAALMLWQCNGENEPTETTDGCPAASTAFASNIQPHIKTDSCDASGCHSSATDEGGFALKAGETNAASNKEGMLAKVKEKNLLDADKLWTYLTGDLADKEHPGKDQLGGLTKEKVTTWVTAEKACE